MNQFLDALRIIAMQLALLKGDPSAHQLLGERNFNCIARTAFGEARGEGLDGMAMVVQSMVNRNAAKGKSGCKIAQHAYDGFRSWKGRSPRDVDMRSWRDARLITLLVVIGEYDLGECSSVTHFLNPSKLRRLPSWANPDNEVCSLGAHVGYHVVNI